MPCPRIVRVLAQMFACLVLGVGALSAAETVEVHLRSGAVVTGEVVSDDPEKLVIKSTAVGKSGKAMTVTIPYKRSDIKEVVKLGDPEEQYQTRSAAAMSAAEHAALAQWCREQNLGEHAVTQAKLAVELDATQELAVKMLSDLDWALVEGKWVRESEALAAQGKVRWQGKVMTVAEADALKAAAQQEGAEKALEKAAEDKAGSLSAIDRQIAELKKRSTQLDADLQKANADLGTAQGLGQKVASAKSAYDSAQASLDSARSNNNNARGPNAGNATNLQPLMLAVEGAQKALAAARREAGNAESQVAQAKGRITALGNEKKALEKKNEALAGKRVAAERALEEAKKAKPPEVKPAEPAKSAVTKPDAAPTPTP